MADNRFDLMIVGTGPAGLTASIYAQRLGMKTVVFGDVPGGNCYMIEQLMNYPGFIGGTTGVQWGVAAFAQAQGEGGAFPMTRLVKLGHREGQFVGLDVNSQEYVSRAAILACGVVPRTLDVPNIDKKGVFFCSLCDGPLFRGKGATLAVIGGGNMAAQETLSLSNFAKKVIIVYRGDQLKAEAVVQRAIDAKDNIEMRLKSRVVALSGEERIDGIVVSDDAGAEKTIPVDGVFMAVGWVPNVDLLEFFVETVPEGYIKTNQKLMTSVPGLFAAGDVRDTDIRQVITACADGARAATYALEFMQGQGH